MCAGGGARPSVGTFVLRAAESFLFSGPYADDTPPFQSPTTLTVSEHTHLGMHGSFEGSSFTTAAATALGSPPASIRSTCVFLLKWSSTGTVSAW